MSWRLEKAEEMKGLTLWKERNRKTSKDSWKILEMYFSTKLEKDALFAVEKAWTSSMIQGRVHSSRLHRSFACI